MEFIVDVQNLDCQINGREVLSNINLKIHPGENLLIMGPNGCGKTTLVKMILGELFAMTGGKIDYFGQRERFYNLWDIRQEIGYFSAYLQRQSK